MKPNPYRMWSIELRGDEGAYHQKTVHEQIDGALQAADEEESEVNFEVNCIRICALSGKGLYTVSSKEAGLSGLRPTESEACLFSALQEAGDILTKLAQTARIKGHDEQFRYAMIGASVVRAAIKKWKGTD